MHNLEPISSPEGHDPKDVRERDKSIPSYCTHLYSSRGLLLLLSIYIYIYIYKQILMPASMKSNKKQQRYLKKKIKIPKNR